MSIEVKNVSFTYNIKTHNEYNALRDVFVNVSDNDYLTIVGQTGSGKSTLVQMLNGLAMPTTGTILIDGETTQELCKKTKTTKNLRKKVGLVFQFPEYQLFEETVEDDVAFGLKNFGYSKEEALEKAHKTLIELGLDESFFKRSPFELSGGEKRRVALAGILSIEPDILVLDEPTAGLDYKGVLDIMSIASKMHEQGKSIILVTHDMDIVLKYVKDVYVLCEGKLVFQGSPIDLFKNDFENFGIEVPPLYSFARKLIDKGYNINLDDVRDVPSLMKQISKRSKQND